MQYHKQSIADYFSCMFNSFSISAFVNGNEEQECQIDVRMMALYVHIILYK